jgi:hypothetical protein
MREELLAALDRMDIPPDDLARASTDKLRSAYTLVWDEMVAMHLTPMSTWETRSWQVNEELEALDLSSEEKDELNGYLASIYA